MTTLDTQKIKFITSFSQLFLLISILVTVIGGYYTIISSFDKRITLLENEFNKGETFTMKDGAIINQKVDFYLSQIKDIKFDIQEIKNDLKRIK